MNRRPPFYKPKPIRDPIVSLTADMRDTLEAGARAMLVFWEGGDVRAVTHPDRVVCKGATMRVLLGLGLFEPVDDGECVQLTREGERLARLSAARRASFRNKRRRDAENLAEGRAFMAKINARRAQAEKEEPQ